jgi:hypothetical protein
MKNDLSNLKKGDKIWTIENGWEKVISICYENNFPIETNNYCYDLNGKRINEKHPSAFLEYPFEEQEIEKDTLVYYRDSRSQSWKVGYYSHFEDGKHWCFIGSKKSTETDEMACWKIITNVNPFL